MIGPYDNKNRAIRECVSEYFRDSLVKQLKTPSQFAIEADIAFLRRSVLGDEADKGGNIIKWQYFSEPTRAADPE